MIKKVNETVSIGNMNWADWVFDEPYMKITNINSALKTIDEVKQLISNDTVIPEMDNIYFDLLDAIDDTKSQLDGLKKEVQRMNKEKRNGR